MPREMVSDEEWFWVCGCTVGKNHTCVDDDQYDAVVDLHDQALADLIDQATAEEEAG